MTYKTEQSGRETLDGMKGPAVVQFGTNWCGHCAAAEPLIEQAFSSVPELPRFKIEDGKGRPLGRSFHVKLWPTLIFLHDGREVARVVRPQSAQDVTAALQRLAAAGTSSTP